MKMNHEGHEEHEGKEVMRRYEVRVWWAVIEGAPVLEASFRVWAVDPDMARVQVDRWVERRMGVPFAPFVVVSWIREERVPAVVEL
jgi:hypothetical protein